MIILKFPETDSAQTSVSATVCEKPSIEEIKKQVSEILEKYFQPSLVERYADTIVKVINNGIAFPDNGIYQIDNGSELIKFDEENGSWDSTGLKVSDYVIKHDSEFWKHFNNEFGFLAELLKSIKMAVKSITENMFFTGKLLNTVTSVDLKGYTVYENDLPISRTLTKAFSYEIAKKIAIHIDESLFKGERNTINILEYGGLKYKVSKSSAEKLTKERFFVIKNILEKYMMKDDAEQMSIMLKNQLLFGVPATLEMQKRDSQGLHLSYNGFDILYSRGKFAVKCTKELFEEITSKTVEMAKLKFKRKFYVSHDSDLGIRYVTDGVPRTERQINISNLDIFSLVFSCSNAIEVEMLDGDYKEIYRLISGGALYPIGPVKEIIGKYVVVEKRHKTFVDD